MKTQALESGRDTVAGGLRESEYHMVLVDGLLMHPKIWMLRRGTCRSNTSFSFFPLCEVLDKEFCAGNLTKLNKRTRIRIEMMQYGR